MLDLYQNLPLKIDPIFFSMGSFYVYWYSLMYLIGFSVVSGLLYYRVYKKENFVSWYKIFDFILYCFLGSILGGRIGYVIFYNLGYFVNNPLEIFLPFSKDGDFIGIYGMSYHGGVLGFILVAYFFTKNNKINFWKILDFILPAVPAGYFFGRIGNFINGELYGRDTTVWWGMDFGDGILRHPSQLYEALGEGVLLFIILWLLRNKLATKIGMISGAYLLGYGIIRFGIEFFRQPDEQLGVFLNYLTMGQILSACMIAVGCYIILKVKRS